MCWPFANYRSIYQWLYLSVYEGTFMSAILCFGFRWQGYFFVYIRITNYKLALILAILGSGHSFDVRLRKLFSKVPFFWNDKWVVPCIEWYTILFSILFSHGYADPLLPFNYFTHLRFSFSEKHWYIFTSTNMVQYVPL